MKALLIKISLLLLLSSATVAQQTAREHRFIPVQGIQQKVKFNVVTESSDTTTREAITGKFRLAPAESKATAITGASAIKVDRSLFPMLKDTGLVNVFMLPEMYYARVAGTDQQISYRILFVDSAPLRYDFDKETFRGSVTFLPVEESDSGEAHPAQKTLSIPEDILISSGSEKIPVHITTVNWPPLDIPVESPDPKDSVEVKVLTVTNPTGYGQNLRIEPAIILSSTRTTIQGFGIQSLPVHVTLKGVTSCKPIPVTVESSRGMIDSASLVLTDDRPHEVILRSEGLGKIDLRCVTPNYRSNVISVEAVFPWLFLLLSLLGGLIGGLGKNLLGQEKVTLRRLALGGIFGFIAAVAYWGLGIVLIGVSFETHGYNEAMVLGFGLIAGFFGLKLVSKGT
jgi:hypothetical protein